MKQVIILNTDKFLYTVNVETITLIETRIIQVGAFLAAFFLFCKYVMPAIITYLKSAQIDAIKNQMENNMSKLHRELIDLNETLKQIRDEIKDQTKLVLVIFLAVSLSACESDKITIYKLKNSKIDEKVPTTVIKDCDPPCTGTLKCNSTTGKCEGTAKDTKTPNMAQNGSSDLIFSFYKYGSLGEREWKIRR